MISRIVALALVASLFGAASCLEDEGPGRFTTSCFDGEERPCACSGGETGVQYCAERLVDEDLGPDGGTEFAFGECACPGCTEGDDCDECGSCVSLCLCQTGRELSEAECARQCDLLGDAGIVPQQDSGATPVDAGEEDSDEPPLPATCDVARCPAGSLPLFPPCCASDNRCGFDVNGACIAANQPGQLDSECPPVDLLGFLTLPGCCRPDGICGVLEDQFFSFGCFDATQLVGGEPVRCTIPR